MVAADINDPPSVSILEIVKRWKDLAQLMGRFERSVLKHPIAIFNRIARVRVTLCSVSKRFPRNDVHKALSVDNMSTLALC